MCCESKEVLKQNIDRTYRLLQESDEVIRGAQKVLQHNIPGSLLMGPLVLSSTIPGAALMPGGGGLVALIAKMVINGIDGLAGGKAQKDEIAYLRQLVQKQDERIVQMGRLIKELESEKEKMKANNAELEETIVKLKSILLRLKENQSVLKKD